MLRLLTTLATLAALGGCAGLETCEPVDADEIKAYQTPSRTGKLELPAGVSEPEYQADFAIPGEERLADHEPSRTAHCLQIPPRVVPIPTEESVEEAREEAKEEKAEEA